MHVCILSSPPLCVGYLISDGVVWYSNSPDEVLTGCLTHAISKRHDEEAMPSLAERTIFLIVVMTYQRKTVFRQKLTVLW